MCYSVLSVLENDPRASSYTYLMFEGDLYPSSFPVSTQRLTVREFLPTILAAFPVVMDLRFSVVIAYPIL